MRYKGNLNRGDIISLWEFLSRGDEQHKMWLLDAIEAWFKDQSRPVVR